MASARTLKRRRQRKAEKIPPRPLTPFEQLMMQETIERFEHSQSVMAALMADERQDLTFTGSSQWTMPIRIAKRFTTS